MQFAMYLASLTGQTSIAGEQAQQLARLASASQYELIFEIISLGYRPTLSSRSLRDALERFGNYDPGAFKAGSGAASDARSTLQTRRQSNMAAVVASVVKSLNDAANSDAALSVQSFVNAFDDFARSTDLDSGEPVALGIRGYTKLEVLLRMAAETILPTWKAFVGASFNMLRADDYQALIEQAQHVLEAPSPTGVSSATDL